MRGGSSGRVLETVGRLFGAGSVAGHEGEELLARFARDGDEAAFEALVRRLGPMVMGVCKRGIGDEHTAEDAFQATFLVLARKASSIRDARKLGPWVYGVARKVSARARADLARRRARERGGNALEAAEPAGRAMYEEILGEELDREVARLPRAYREVVIACDLEGLSHEAAARRLGWPVGTVKGRLHRARGKLRDRLEAKGAGPWTASLPALLATGARRPIPEALVQATVGSARAIAAGGAVAASAAVSAEVFSLSEGVVSAMFWSKLKPLSAVMLVVVAVGGGAWAAQRQETPEADAAPESPIAQPAAVGTTANRLARDKLEVARRQYEQLLKGYLDRSGSLGENQGEFQDWERRWRDALAEPQLAPEDRAGALRAHRNWIDSYEARLVEDLLGMIRGTVQGYGIQPSPLAIAGRPKSPDSALKFNKRQEESLMDYLIANDPRFELVRYFRLECQTRLAETGLLAPIESNPGPAASLRLDPNRGPVRTEKTTAILATLDRPLKLELMPRPLVSKPEFAFKSSTLSRDLSQILEATRSHELPGGLPLVGEPSLHDPAWDSGTSGFDHGFNLGALPLGVSLKWLLWSKGLDFAVHDDLVHISTRERLRQVSGLIPGYGVAGSEPDEATGRRIETVRRALEHPVELTAPDGRTILLSHALEQIQRATVGPDLPGGLPFIAVESSRYGPTRNLVGLVQEEATPVRVILERMLRKYNFRYGIAEGLVVIGPNTDEAMPPIEPSGGELIGQ